MYRLIIEMSKYRDLLPVKSAMDLRSYWGGSGIDSCHTSFITMGLPSVHIPSKFRTFFEFLNNDGMCEDGNSIRLREI